MMVGDRPVRRTLRHGHASAGDERDEDEQEGKKPSHHASFGRKCRS